MPEWTGELRTRLASLHLRGSREAEIVEELSQHLDERYEELRAIGTSDAEARRLVIEELLEPEALARYMRPLRLAQVPAPATQGATGGTLAAGLWQDLRYAARMLRKQPGFATAAILTLALGIGATTAIFSLIDAAWLRDLPFPDADRLAVIWADNSRLPQGLPSAPAANADIASWRVHTESFTSVAAFSSGTADIAEGGPAERVGAARVTAGFFETLGVIPPLGRTLTAEEEAPGGPPVVLIGHGLWQRRFGGDPSLIGKGITVNGSTRTVIGILPPDFDFPRGAEWPAFFPFAGRTEVWFPLAYRAYDDGSGWSNWQSRQERGLVAFGRLEPGVSLRQAQAEMDAYAARQATDHPDTHRDTALKLVSMRMQLAGHTYNSLQLLSAAAGLLLVIACVNVANLMLARGVGRHQEIAVRVALGAGRGRLRQQLLTECLLLATLASGLGLVVAYLCVRIFLVLNPVSYSRLNEASIDPAALCFAAAATLATILMVGLLPTLQASRFDLRSSLAEGGRGGDAAARGRVRTWLVAAQVALALVLLAAAGLMVRSFLRVHAVQPGFRAGSVLVFDLQLPASYKGEASWVSLFDELTARLESLPAVRAAGAISYLPLGGGQNRGSFAVEGEPPPTPGSEPKAERRWVTPGYFAAMGIPIRAGRVFTSSDNAVQSRVAVINDTMVRQFFSGADPIGRRVRMGGAWRTVVGVVSDVKSASLEGDATPQIYVPLAQWPWPGLTVVVQTNGNPLAHVSAIRAELKALDPLLPAANMRTMEQVVSKAGGVRRFNMALLAFFAFTALLLTAIGIYGVVAFMVGRRSREIGIRIALGARRIDILMMVIRQGMKPVVAGAAGGLVASLAATRVLASQLYGVSASDPLTLTGIVVLVIAATLVACWLPARRAASIAPVSALRTD